MRSSVSAGPLKWSAIAHALIDVLRGLKYLHEVDIVHGDIKGANVMLKSVHKSVSPVKFTAKLADLGLAQLRGNAVRFSSQSIARCVRSSFNCLRQLCQLPSVRL